MGDRNRYEYRDADGNLICTHHVPHPAEECSECGSRDVKDKGSFYRCNQCGHRGEHGLRVYEGGKDD